MEFRRSTFCSAPHCVEVGWQTSSYCANGSCVEVACATGNCVEVSGHSACGTGSCVEVQRDAKVNVRDSKYVARGEESPVLVFNRKAWAEVLTAIRAGEDPPNVFYDETGAIVWVWESLDKTDDELARLEFDQGEWDAFVKGVKAGEFEVLS